MKYRYVKLRYGQTDIYTNSALYFIFIHFYPVKVGSLGHVTSSKDESWKSTVQLMFMKCSSIDSAIDPRGRIRVIQLVIYIILYTVIKLFGIPSNIIINANV